MWRNSSILNHEQSTTIGVNVRQQKKSVTRKRLCEDLLSHCPVLLFTCITGTERPSSKPSAGEGKEDCSRTGLINSMSCRKRKRGTCTFDSFISWVHGNVRITGIEGNREGEKRTFWIDEKERRSSLDRGGKICAGEMKRKNCSALELDVRTGRKPEKT